MAKSYKAVDELPKKKRRKSIWIDVLTDFINGSAQVGEVNRQGRNLKTSYIGLYAAIKRMKLEDTVCLKMRDGEMYLCRIKGDETDG